MDKILYPIYDQSKDEYYANFDKIKDEAISFFISNLNIFNDSETIYTSYTFQEEYFLLEFPSMQIKKNSDILYSFSLPIVVYNKNLTTILTLYKLEYEIEIISFTSNS